MKEPILTPAQERVLKLVMKGKTNEEIAQILGVVLATVKAHIMSLFRKLKVTNRVLLVLKGQKLGY
jgi:DNA-binding CsgD family transcriptional regulator